MVTPLKFSLFLFEHDEPERAPRLLIVGFPLKKGVISFPPRCSPEKLS